MRRLAAVFCAPDAAFLESDGAEMRIDSGC